ncbi:MAG: MATE family efflux transporter [Agathobacter sp.]|nr:MATE family efflux transporter [Agathobacter sp.]
MSQFMKSLCKIAIPVTLQSMLQASFSIIDQIMIGQLRETNISAVGLGGSFTLIFSVVIGAIGGVAGILIAQFLGSEDHKEAWSSFSISMLVSLLISTLFFVAAFFFTGQILSLYTKDSSIISAGGIYFKMIAFAYIPMGISVMLSTWLRCKEHATIPFLASLGAVLVNTGLNYILIFGKFGQEAMGIKGAGIATLVSQLFNMVLIIVGFLICLKLDREKFIFSLRLSKITPLEYIAMIMPILVSEFMWSLGQNVESAVYGHLGTQNLAAYTLTCPVQGLMVGALSGLSAAAGVLIGKRLGKKEYDQAYSESKKIMYAGMAGSLVVATILIIFSSYYVGFYKVSQHVKDLGVIILIVFALYIPVKVENMIIGGGIIKSGGDTRTILVIDLLGTWFVGIPLCFFAAYVLNWGIVGVYTLLTTEEIVRLVISLIVFKKRKWMISLS